MVIPEKKIRDLHNYFTKNHVEIKCCDFSKIVDIANKGDVIYFDPPYDYDDEGFTKYVANDFTRNDLNRLKKVADELINKGCRVIISNNDTQYVNKLFDNGKYKIDRITVTRFISCNGDKREKANEVIIYG